MVNCTYIIIYLVRFSEGLLEWADKIEHNGQRVQNKGGKYKE